MNTFSERLSLAIKKREMSQSEAARMAGISQQSMNYIIKNKLKSSKLAPKIASVLSINPEWLIYGRGQFEDATAYEIPILRTPYSLIKFINNDIAHDDIKYIVIDTYLGELAFAYVFEPKKMVICGSLNRVDSVEFLTLDNNEVAITKEASKSSFPIFEWRSRNVEF